jgi:hypothetical protein
MSSRQPPAQGGYNPQYIPPPSSGNGPGSAAAQAQYRDRDDAYYRQGGQQGYDTAQGQQGYSTASGPAYRDGERRPLLGSNNSNNNGNVPPPPSNPNGAPADPAAARKREQHKAKRGIVAGVLTFLFILAMVMSWFFYHDGMVLGRDPVKAARGILGRAPVIVSFVCVVAFCGTGADMIGVFSR